MNEIYFINHIFPWVICGSFIIGCVIGHLLDPR